MNVGNTGLNNQYYYATLNRVKLAAALQKNPRYQQQIQSSGSNAALEPISKIDRVSLQKDIDFMEEYATSMTDLMQSASDLRLSNRTGSMSRLEVGSSNQDVAEVSQRMTLRNSMDLTVSVSQVATAQQNSSQGVRASSLASGDLGFTITDGSNQALTVDISSVSQDGVARTNREQLKEAAERINSRDEFGVRAYVEERDGVSSLYLQAKETGVANSFHVSVESGSLLGIEQERTQAKDAVYTVKEGNRSMEYQSSSNEVTLDFGRVNMRLKSAGETNISIQPDVSAVSESFSKLIDSYNNAMTMLNENSSRGTGVAMHQRSFQQGLAPSATLERMGITVGKDNTLSLDKDKLESRLKAEPELTKQLIGGTHSIAQTAFNKANAALRTSSESLINQSGGFGKAMSGMNALFGNYTGLGLVIDYLV